MGEKCHGLSVMNLSVMISINLDFSSISFYKYIMLICICIHLSISFCLWPTLIYVIWDTIIVLGPQSYGHVIQEFSTVFPWKFFNSRKKRSQSSLCYQREKAKLLLCWSKMDKHIVFVEVLTVQDSWCEYNATYFYFIYFIYTVSRFIMNWIH